MEVTLTTKGQITLPKALRDSLHLKTGDKIIFEEQDNGTYLLKARKADVSVLKGCVSYKGAPATLDDMEAAIAKNAGA